MIRSSRKSYVAVAAALLLLAASAPAAPPEKEALPNFHKVTERLYRGAQPREGGVERLRELGVKTIINLRSENEQTQGEERAARAAGMNYYSIPLPDLGRPPLEQVERALDIMEDPASGVVFIHCNHGKDRTGTVIACYRIQHDRWTLKEAMDEAKRYGMSWVQFKMKDFISDYYRDRRGADTPAPRSVPQPPRQ